MRIYRSGNIALGASPSQWINQLQTHLIEAGWILFDDQFTSPVAASGFRVYRSPVSRGSAFDCIKITVDGTTTKFQAVYEWDIVTHTPVLYKSWEITLTHDLANGFNYFLDANSDFCSMFFETVANISSPVYFGIQTPIAKTSYHNRPELPEPRAVIAATNLSGIPKIYVSHYVVSVLLASFAPATYTSGTLVSGDSASTVASYETIVDMNLIPAFVGGGFTINNALNSSSDFANIIYSPYFAFGQTDDGTTAANNNYVGGLLYVLNGYYITNITSGNRVAIVTEKRDTLHGSPYPVSLASNLVAGALSCTLAGDVTSFPASGILRIDSEWVAYSGRVGQNFTLSQRGLFGTTDSSHITSGLFSDDFNRASLGANYSIPVVAGMTIDILANKMRIRATATLSNVITVLTGLTAMRNYRVSFTANFGTLITAASAINIRLRKQGTNNYLNVKIAAAGQQIILTHVINGIASESRPYSNVFNGAVDNTFKIEVIDKVVKIFLNNRNIINYAIVSNILLSSTSQLEISPDISATDSNKDLTIDNLLVESLPIELSYGEWWIKSGNGAIYAGTQKP